jgi:hypothetical protein
MERIAEITSLLAKYATGNDSNDVSMIGECFTNDAVFELVVNGNDKPPLVFVGREAIEGLMRSSMESQGDIRRHFSTNLRILSIDVSSARISSYSSSSRAAFMSTTSCGAPMAHSSSGAISPWTASSIRGDFGEVWQGCSQPGSDDVRIQYNSSTQY